MVNNLSRRDFLKVAATGTGMLALAACVAPVAPQAATTGDAPAAAAKTIRIAWWGGDLRHEKYKQILDLYEQVTPGVKMEREFSDWAPYWEKLATQIASGNGPDIIHTHQNLVNEYANRGALEPLDALVSASAIDLSDFPAGTVAAGKRGGVNWMIALGASVASTIYNKNMLEQAGVPLPENNWNWDDYAETVRAAQGNLGGDIYGSTDQGGWDDALQIFMRQNGFELFAGEGLKELGFTKEALAAWWNYWATLRQDGIVPPAELTTEFSQASHGDSMLAKRMVAGHLMNVNQLQIFQEYMEDELNAAPIPRNADPNASPGDFLGAAWLSLYAQSAYKEEGAAFTSWFINDPEPAKIFMAEHGPPGSRKIVELLKPMVSAPVQKGFDLISAVAEKVSAAGERPNQGGEVLAAQGRIYQEVAFGRMSVDAGVDAFFEEANRLLAA